MKRFDFKRLTACILLIVCFLQAAIPAFADSEEIGIGKINIISGYEASTEWDAAVCKAGGESIIMLRAEDIAAIAGVELRNADGILTFDRMDSYQVVVDLDKQEASAQLYCSDEEQYQLYGGEFKIRRIAYLEGADEQAQIYLPLEEMFYLLHVSWNIRDGAVVAVSPQDTLFSIMGDYIEMCGALPTYADIVGETVGEIYGNAFKYTFLSIADEVDWRIFSGYQFDVSKTEEVLLEMAAPATSMLDDNEIELLGSYVDSYYTPTAETLDRLMAFSDELKLDDLGDELLGELTGIKFSDIGLKATTVVSVASKLCNIYEVTTRSSKWSEGYLDQLSYLSNLPNTEDNKAVRQAAKNHVSEHENALGTAAWEAGKIGIQEVASEIVKLKAAPVYFAKKAYDLTVEGLKLTIPEFAETLATGDYAHKAKAAYNIATITRIEYINAMNKLLSEGVTEENLEQVRITGTLMCNAAAHAWRNQYYVERNEGGDATVAKLMMQDNCGYLTRIEQSVQFDERLLIDRDYSNLYSNSEGAVRVKIPVDYVEIDPNANKKVVSEGYVLYDGFIQKVDQLDSVPEGYTGIYSFDDLKVIADHNVSYGNLKNEYNTANYILMNDIVCPAEYESINLFAGVLDGNGYMISNVSVPLIAGISGATIRNLGISVSYTVDKQDEEVNYGALAVWSEATVYGYWYTDDNVIDNCFTRGNISISCRSAKLGALIADAGGNYAVTTITNCYNQADIRLRTRQSCYAGGILGNSGTVVNGFNTGDIDVHATCGNTFNVYSIDVIAGGIVGYDGGAENCYNTGDIRSGADSACGVNAGGIVGSQPGWNGEAILRCYNTGDISVYHQYPADRAEELTEDEEGNESLFGQGFYCGGITGMSARDATIERCRNDGNVSGTRSSGGIVGLMAGDAEVENCLNTGNVKSEKHAGGIVGNMMGRGKLTNCLNTGGASGAAETGALAGVSALAQDGFENCYFAEGSLGATASGMTYTTAKALSAEAMTVKESFEGFDFMIIWKLEDGKIKLKF